MSDPLEHVSAGLILHAMHMSRLESDLGDGLAAAIHLYYEDYSDADHLEDDFLAWLRQLERFVTVSDFDVDEVIRDTEKSIRENTGRRVRTLSEEEE